MVCDIQTQLLHGERNGVSGGLRLTVIQAMHTQPLWRCELRGDYVEVDCGHGPSRVSSRTALKLLLQELILRSAFGEDSFKFSSQSNQTENFPNKSEDQRQAFSVVSL